MLRFSLVCLLASAVSVAPNEDPFPALPNIKGLQVQMVPDALELGIHHAGINVNLTALLDLEKKSENPSHAADGETFSFNAGYLASLDAQIKPLSDHGVAVYLILLVYPSKDGERDAITIHPDAREDHQYTVGAFNNVTPQGRAYLQAVVEFLAARWSGAQPEHGRVWGWIVGNEVNSHWMWYNLGRKPLVQAVGEYESAFRIIHGAVRKASRHARLYISFDHHWGISMHGISAEEATPGREYLDTFARLVKERGDMDWHVAWHPYPEDLGNPRAWADKSVTRDDSTPKVTFKNLEVLPRHLEKPELLFQGKARRVILSEQGFHTLLTPEGDRLQAAAYAYAWEKCRSLPTVDAFIYHRHVDHAKEGGLRLGLWRNAPGSIADPHSKKPLWELFRKAGTAEWEGAAGELLPVTGLKSWGE
ncbi:hypothetical protein EI77_00706 [Prosthecobacter fusiformis]|uniref:DUF5722 domain-containing protein n=1 Tax=Prosthecobacter fusiformis TaxID=48464 RepID=A0A4R7ST35_9BACT|nr:DUF5722 domain-containing protein [Prosthecobacter fusiformis]TDU81398.1 hypothetical protein EI77_00706 [Prosthecobacter fusiformis]